jgi:hypothetical protein
MRVRGRGPKLREWSLDAIADAVAGVLAGWEARLEREQAVYGLDSLEEVELHPVIARGLGEATGLGVLREQPYPHEWRRKVGRAKGAPAADAGEGAVVLERDPEADGLPPLSPDEDEGTISAILGELLPRPRDRKRCDLVLTERPGQRLDDALLNEKARRRRKKQVEGTLFEGVEGAAAAESAPAAPASVPPTEALWLEIKLVGQHCYTSGVPGPNRAYAGEITRHAVTDLKKLEADARIRHGALCLILFTETEAVARHDAAAMLHRCLDRDLPVGSPVLRHVPIQDRIGNRVCTVCVVGVRKV